MTAGDVSTGYTRPVAGSTGAHQVTKAVTTPASGAAKTDTFTYDAAGNTLTRALAGQSKQTLTWDAEGRLASLTAGTTNHSYTYTADGDRLVRREANTTTVYLPGGGEITRTGSTTSAIRYYAFNGNVVASRTTTGAAGVTTVVGNSQHTPQLAINNGSNTPVRRHHDPYGNPRDKTPVTWVGDHGFLDKPTDSTGLTHIGARYYDPGLGQFISPDPLLFTEVPQQFHPYNYAHANPTTLTDPTGLAAMSFSIGGGGGRSYFNFRSFFRSVITRTFYRPPAPVFRWRPQASSASSRPAVSSWGASSYGRSSYSSYGQAAYVPSRSLSGSYRPAVVRPAQAVAQPSSIMTALHTGLDALGQVPGAGEVADGTNAVLYAIQGDWRNAAMSAAAMIPFIGNAATGARLAKNVARGAKEVSEAVAKWSGKNTNSRTVYRGLAASDDPSVGLVARAPNNSGVTPISHVAGKIQSPWISTSKSADVATSMYGQHGVVAIDLNKVTSEVVDISGGFPNGGRMSNWAKAHQEVLIRGSVPPEAITRYLP